MYRLSLFVCICSAVLMTAPLAQAFSVPDNDGFYTQNYGELTDDQEQHIEDILSAYQKETSNEIAILLTETLDGADIDQTAVEVGRAWGVGTKDKNNGVLILVATGDRAISIQTGYGLEGALPDIVVHGIIEDEITPFFKNKDYNGGLLAGIDAIEKHIGGEYKADRYDTSGGGPGIQVLFVFGLIFLNLGGAFLGRTKSWWLGGVLGGVMGFILMLVYSWWIAIPMFIALGLGFDYIVSKNPPGRGGRGGRGGFWGGGFGGGGGSGGGFGGFGGGSFGGGGSSGRW